MKLRHSGKKPILVHPVRPNAGIEVWLRRQIISMLSQMHASVMYWTKASWRKSDLPETHREAIAQDATPAAELNKAMKKLAEQWGKNFDQMSEHIAKAFAKKAMTHNSAAFQAALRKAGFSVKFKPTKRVNDALEAQMMDNVNLIKSIPQEYLDDVHGHVMRSVAQGRSLKQLTQDLQDSYGISKRRAAFIARDQNNKATAIIHKTQQEDAGITMARWVHTSASKKPRPEHQHWGDTKATYDIKEGMWSDVSGKYVWPGTEPNCGCTSMSIIPTDED